MKLHICAGFGGARPDLLLFLEGLPPKLRQKLILEFAMLTSTPLGLLGEPHVKHFSLEKYREFYELRAKGGKVMVRIILPKWAVKFSCCFPSRKSRRGTRKRRWRWPSSSWRRSGRVGGRRWSFLSTIWRRWYAVVLDNQAFL